MLTYLAFSFVLAYLNLSQFILHYLTYFTILTPLSILLSGYTARYKNLVYFIYRC